MREGMTMYLWIDGAFCFEPGSNLLYFVHLCSVCVFPLSRATRFVGAGWFTLRTRPALSRRPASPFHIFFGRSVVVSPNHSRFC